MGKTEREERKAKGGRKGKVRRKEEKLVTGEEGGMNEERKQREGNKYILFYKF
jgi:hypothetical protein